MVQLALDKWIGYPTWYHKAVGQNCPTLLPVLLVWNVKASATKSCFTTKCSWPFYIAEMPSLKVFPAEGEGIAVPKLITQYRVFIGSPSGLEDERKKFFSKLVKFSEVHAEPQGVLFHPVGWEYTIGGVGRPQEQINDDLRQCDYAVFVLHDRWGSETGAGFTSGKEEEWTLAEQLYDERKIRNIVLLFKSVDPRYLRDPGKQLEKVLSFRKKLKMKKCTFSIPILRLISSLICLKLIS
jgi:hypothetical protein